MINLIKTVLFTILLCFQVITMPVPVSAIEVGEGSGIDLADLEFTDDQNQRFVVMYIYMENNEENPYNNPDRDIRMLFEGTELEGYLDIYHHNYVGNQIYERYQVVRETLYLPDHEDGYFVTPLLSDASSSTSAYLLNVNGKDGGSYPLELEAYNEVYVVVGNPDWVRESGQHKLDELYMLFHSGSGSITDNPATEQMVEDETFSYWQNEMQKDGTITAWKDADGTVYTREDMCERGYEVPLEEEKKEPEETAEATADQPAETETPQDAPTEEAVPDIPSNQEPVSGGLPPLVILIGTALLASAAAFIAYIRKERNESDLYID